MLFYFGHYLKGKKQENYNSPVEKNEKVLKDLILAQIDLKDMMAGKGKKMKILRKNVEYKFIDLFKDSHFGILPLTKNKL